MKESYTNLKTSKLMEEACSVETGMWWRSLCELAIKKGLDKTLEEKGEPYLMPAGTKHEKIPSVWETVPAHTLATAIQWLEEYGKKMRWEYACKFCGSLDCDPGYSPSTTDNPEEYNPYCKKCGAPWMDGYEFDEGAEVPRSEYEKHILLNAFIAGNYNMASKDVSDFISGLIGKDNE